LHHHFSAQGIFRAPRSFGSFTSSAQLFQSASPEPFKPKAKTGALSPSYPETFGIGPGLGGLIGRVTDKNTGESLPSAQIALPGTKKSGFTDMDGIYEIIDLPPGAYTVQASMVGYEILEIKKVRIRPDKRTYLYFKLKPIRLPRESRGK
jgi:hypothetical protein